MPPEKLKSRKFLPSDRSDIFSLGVCVYEIIFGFHPYVRKKTANYKEYLKTIEDSVLKPIPVLMKKVGSSSLKLETFLTFLEHMIDLNHRTRATLPELKQFLKTTEPFMNMEVVEPPPAPLEEDR